MQNVYVCFEYSDARKENSFDVINSFHDRNMAIDFVESRVREAWASGDENEDENEEHVPMHDDRHVYITGPVVYQKTLPNDERIALKLIPLWY